jgi:glycosyltransferase involved in cell wall biosynthesis
MPRRPLVSIIIPVKDGERFLPQALADVHAQTYAEREMIVVDGGSTDRSAEIARTSPGVRCISQSGEGFADAWNVGLAASSGDLIAFLDSDDRWMPDKLARQVEVLEQRAEVDYVITRVRFFLEPGMAPPPGFRGTLLSGDHVGNMPSALLARRRVFELIGDFPTHLSVANDIDWFARLRDSGLTREVVPEAMVMKRVHDANLSFFSGQNFNSELLALLRESVARKNA